jgi:hypothetical protein
MSLFGKNLKKYFFDFFAQKETKMHFWEKLENEAFFHKLFFYNKSYISKHNLKQALRSFK